MEKSYLDFFNSLSEKGKKIFTKLPEERRELVFIVMEKLNKGGLNWERGWIGGGMFNPITNTHYKGVNSLFLYFRAKSRNYTESRWVTFNQMTQKGWRFKKDDKGNSLGKGAGTPVEYFAFYDKLTKKPIDWKKFTKMTKEGQKEYWNKNIKVLFRSYIVFNCSLMDGVPELKPTNELKAELNEKAETIIKNSAAPVSYDGGDRAYYRPSTDSIHLPERKVFKSYEEFLGTALHEIGHSTGHPTRLNRETGGFFGSESYAKEELNAELFSLFEQQELAVNLPDSHIENHSAYLESWGKEIKDNPNYLFAAISNAQKMVEYVNEIYLAQKSEVKQEDNVFEQYSAAFLEQMSGLLKPVRFSEGITKNINTNSNESE